MLEAGGGRLRRLGPQRRLVQRAVPDRPGTRWSRASSRGRRPPHAPRDAGDGPRGRPGRRGRGDRRALPARRDASPWRAPRVQLRAAAGRGRDGARPRVHRGRRAAARAPTRRAPMLGRRRRPRRRRSPRTARRSTPRGWCAGSRRVVEAAGVPIFEQHPGARHRSPAGCETDAGTVRAEVVLRATEGYTPRLAGLRRAVAPVYSLMVATEPLAEATLGVDRAGRPADVHRRAAPDHLRPAHRRRPAGVRRPRGAVPLRLAHPAVVRRGAAGLRRPARRAARAAPAARRRARSPTRGAAASASPATGPPRSGWTAATGIGWAGGYVGDGVATTNLAGRTLADLVTGADSDLVTLPWVDHRSRRWEPEPLRWLGINAGLRAMPLADAEERWTGRPSRIARLMAPLTGGH